jgi:hypothetical protein
MWYLVLGFCLTVGSMLPWWSVFVWCALLGAIAPNKFEAAKNGFLGVAVGWAMIGVFMDLRDQAVVSQNLASVFGVKHHQVFLLFWAFAAGLLGGLSGLLGAWARGRLHKSQQ